MVLQKLPEDIQRYILGAWLEDIKDFFVLDTALCNHNARGVFLSMLPSISVTKLSFPLCKTDEMNIQSILWFRSRKLRFTDVAITDYTGATYLLALMGYSVATKQQLDAPFANNIKSLQLSGYLQEPYVESISQIFELLPNLKHVETNLQYTKFTHYAVEHELFISLIASSAILESLTTNFQSRIQYPVSFLLEHETFQSLQKLSLEGVYWSDANVITLVTALPLLSHFTLRQILQAPINVSYTEIGEPLAGFSSYAVAIPHLPHQVLPSIKHLSLSRWAGFSPRARQSILPVYLLLHSPNCQSLHLGEGNINPLCLYGLQCLFTSPLLSPKHLSFISMDCAEYSESVYGIYSYEIPQMLLLPPSVTDFAINDLFFEDADTSFLDGGSTITEEETADFAMFPSSFQRLWQRYQSSATLSEVATIFTKTPLRALSIRSVTVGEFLLPPNVSLKNQGTINVDKLLMVKLNLVSDLSGTFLGHILVYAKHLQDVDISTISMPQSEEDTATAQLVDMLNTNNRGEHNNTSQLQRLTVVTSLATILALFSLYLFPRQCPSCETIQVLIKEKSSIRSHQIEHLGVAFVRNVLNSFPALKTLALGSFLDYSALKRSVVVADEYATPGADEDHSPESILTIQCLRLRKLEISYFPYLYTYCPPDESHIQPMISLFNDLHQQLKYLKTCRISGVTSLSCASASVSEELLQCVDRLNTM